MRLTRRTFLKGTAATIGGAALAKGLFEKSNTPAVAETNEEITFTPERLDYYPPFDKWDNWREPDGDYWKKYGGALRNGVKMINYMLVPTVCNNCEAACGLTAWVDKDNLVVKKYMGNPFHSGSRGRNCAKGYATQSQMYDPDRIPFPLKRAPGSKVVIMDPRLSNSAGMADLWIPVWPGTEAAVYLAMISRLLQEDKYNRKFMERWVNWKTFIKDKDYLQYLKENGFISKIPEGETFDDFIAVLKEIYKPYTFEWAAEETKVPVYKLEKLYEMILWAGDRITSYFWRAQAAGNRGGWMSAGRTGYFLLIVTGAIGGVGGNGWHHWHVLGVGAKGGKATLKEKPKPVDDWNELLWPPEWPLSTYELSFLLPHLLSDDEWRKKWEKRGLKIPSNWSCRGKTRQPVCRNKT